MRRSAKVVGWAVFLLSLIGPGAIALALLGIRSPLADGSFAPGPEPMAYVITGLTIAAGAGMAGLVMAWLVELAARLLDRR